MSNVTNHERPGVYSVFGASAVVQGSQKNSVAALAAISTGGTAGTLYSIGSLAEAVTTFGSSAAITSLIKLLLLNGAARVLAVPVADATGYAAAFSLLAQQPNVKVTVCDSDTLTVQQALRDSVVSASGNRAERIAVVCGGASETVSQLVTRASGLNSERVVLVAPRASTGGGAALAAAVAGAICGESDPAIPLGGAQLQGLSGITPRYSESEIDTLVQGGVTPTECVGGICSVIRGVTTKTTTSGVADTTWRELSTILVADDVIPAVRSALAVKFNRIKNTAQSRAAICSQVILELEAKKSAEIITEYTGVTAQALESQPTVCLVEFSFQVAHGLSQIWLSAQMTV